MSLELQVVWTGLLGTEGKVERKAEEEEILLLKSLTLLIQILSTEQKSKYICEKVSEFSIE